MSKYKISILGVEVVSPKGMPFNVLDYRGNVRCSETLGHIEKCSEWASDYWENEARRLWTQDLCIAEAKAHATNWRKVGHASLIRQLRHS